MRKGGKIFIHPPPMQDFHNPHLPVVQPYLPTTPPHKSCRSEWPSISQRMLCSLMPLYLCTCYYFSLKKFLYTYPYLSLYHPLTLHASDILYSLVKILEALSDCLPLWIGWPSSGFPHWPNTPLSQHLDPALPLSVACSSQPWDRKFHEMENNVICFCVTLGFSRVPGLVIA